MNTAKRITGVMGVILATFSILPLSEGLSIAAPSGPAPVNEQKETLNPEGINPHASAPRKRITEEQKRAAAEARKKKQAERAALKAGQQQARPAAAGQDASSDPATR